ncbi:MAG: aminopeptidase [Candidatus Hodarchaeales archaeon]
MISISQELVNRYNAQEYFKDENEPILENYQKTIKKITLIHEETQKLIDLADNSNKEYFSFFNHTADKILRLCDVEKSLNNGYFLSKEFNDLLNENNNLYSELTSNNYKYSYANPTYSVSVFGKSFGQLLSFFYKQFRNYIEYAYTHTIYKMYEYNELFIEVYKFIKENELDYEKIKEIITRPNFTTNSRDNYIKYKQRHDQNYRYYTDILENADLTDLRYLFTTGHYIGDNEIKIAQFLKQYPIEKIQNLAKEIVKAYQKSFNYQKKDITKKSTIGLIYKIGLERIFREIIKEFRKINLETTVVSAHSTNINKQYAYDHKFDRSLYLSDEYTTVLSNRFEKGLERNKSLLAEYSGFLYIVKFGEKPFTPVQKKNNLKLNETQRKLSLKLNNIINQIYRKYINTTETSFCMVAFPVPEIGEKFEEIFEGTIEINMLDSDKYERIQQKIIDAIDSANYIHVKGKEGNETNLQIKLHELNNSEETNFINGGATSNIPVGEIFTSPKLNGSNGILHVEEAYLAGFRYENLKIIIKDGYTTNFTCTNFDSDEENKKYLTENLLFPHKTLPIGEFAIGTNTLAYAFSRKYKIMNVLTMLILEKTGPHIALGDTCFARSEDFERYNQINNKLFIATDNEKSILRKTNITEAYTNTHKDITIPYDSIDFISATTGNGERIDIIKNGKFVLDGTHELNEPLENDT